MWKRLSQSSHRYGSIPLVVTYHPAYLLRLPDAQAQAKAYAAFVADLRFAAGLAA